MILMNPGEGRIVLREWPAENFIALGQKLLEWEDVIIIAVGASDCQKKAEEMRFGRFSNGKFINLAGKTTIEELMVLFSISECLIANDCGLAHLASLTPIKQYILFGPESPRVFSPLGNNIRTFYSELTCSPCLSAYNHRTSICNNNKCLQLFDPQNIYDVISTDRAIQKVFKN